MATEVLDHLVDEYHRPLHVGVLVAYNFSGWVRRGVIQKIIKARTGYREKYVFHIKQVDMNNQILGGDRISKVRNVNNLINIGSLTYH